MPRRLGERGLNVIALAAAQDAIYRFDAHTLLKDMSAAQAAAAVQTRRHQQLQAALASRLHRGIPHADIKRFGEDSVLPALIIAHLRATMAAGEIYSIPRIGCDAAVTDIESVLGVGDPLHHLAKLEAEAGDHGLSLHIETQQEALALPMGKTLFFQILHTAPSRQKLVQASAVAGRFTAADIIVHFLPVAKCTVTPSDPAMICGPSLGLRLQSKIYAAIFCFILRLMPPRLGDLLAGTIRLRLRILRCVWMEMAKSASRCAASDWKFLAISSVRFDFKLQNRSLAIAGFAGAKFLRCMHLGQWCKTNSCGTMHAKCWSMPSLASWRACT